MPESATQRQRRVLIQKAQLLWRLVTTTAGVADLAEPMARVEHDFGRLTKGQRTTVAVIAQLFDRGCHEIDAEQTRQEVREEVKEAIEADEVKRASPEKEA